MRKNKEKIISELRKLIEDIERNDIEISKFVCTLRNDYGKGFGSVEVEFENAPIHSE